MLTPTFSFIFALLATRFATCGLIGKASTPHYSLTADDILILGNDGQVEIASRKDIAAYTGGVPLATEAQHSLKVQMEDAEDPVHKIDKRCLEQTIWKMSPAESYLGWDVAMSGVIRAPAHTNATVNVGSGYWIGNSLTVSTSSAFKLVESFLSTTLGISYAKSWTSTYTAAYSFNIPPGKYGAVVTNPLLTRNSGTADIGCVGDFKRIDFSGESYHSKSYSSMKWVEGIIGLCLGDTYPLPRCLGNGTL